ncbi:uncharacterized protein PRCAT00004792001 [Priceomyces carsonii]|uniref:uncharacterized protein n=1 Tax=Priceomyces carsonii TaxID=28549 RepID=UPI002ED7AA75|nr:unnamed protein product [Priceomyces carsonii]
MVSILIRKLMIALILWVYLSSSKKIPTRDYNNKNYFVVELQASDKSEPLKSFLKQHQDYEFEHPIIGLDDHYVFSINKSHPHNEFLGNFNSNNEHLIKRSPGFEEDFDDLVNNQDIKSIHMLPPKRLERRMPVPMTDEEKNIIDKRGGATDSAQERIKKVSKELSIKDPIFNLQWHLINTLYPGHDVNASGLWYEGITGKGIVTAIVDDGLDYESMDLKDNFNLQGSWDFNDNRNNPFPSLADDYHGTRCAGEIAAVRNDVCGIGVAYDSQVSGIRILSGSITAADEAAAMMYGLDVNDIYSCSWGPTDDGRTLARPDLIVRKAMVKGIQEGRKNKGSVYVFASGNGARFGDSCNFDGYTNSIYSITVGAVDHKGIYPTYSEACSAVMVVTYSAGSGEHIHTTDIRKKCTSLHGGTSAAAPLAAGIYSLVLQANSNLTWRDVQYVSALSAVPINEDDGNYQMTAIGRKYSHRYGFGKLDAYKLAHFAQTWKNVNPQTWYYSDSVNIDKRVTVTNDDNGLMKSIVTVTEDDLKVTNFKRVEHITVNVNVDASYRGRVGIKITSPFGVVSNLAVFRPLDSSKSGFNDWNFMSVAHWGESGLGNWTLEVFGDKHQEPNHIHFKSWSMKLFGESSNPEKAEKFDIGKDYAAERRDRLDELKNEKTSTKENAVPTTTSTSSTQKSKETTKAPNKTTSKTSSSHTTLTSKAGQSGHQSATLDPEEGKNKHYTSDHTGQYFMALAVLGFIIVIVFMRFHKTPGSSRRRRRRDEYEFDIIPGEDYSDSNVEDDEDSLDLGPRNDQRRYDRQTDEARDRLFEQYDPLADQDHDEMFKIDDDEDHHATESLSKSSHAEPENTEARPDPKTTTAGDS